MSALRRALAAGFNQSGGAELGSSAKRTAAAGFSSGGGNVLGLGQKQSNAVVFSAALKGGGSQISATARFSAASAQIAGGSRQTGLLAKIAALLARSAGGGVQIVDLGLPGTPDVVLIAGRWIVAAAITGVVPGAVTVAALKDALPLAGKSAPVIALDGKPSRSAEIEGTRKRT